MPETYPNQRQIKIHREVAKKDFLGIKNENWMYASRDLGAHALRLYLYLAANADNYTLALSPAAVRSAIGIPRSTYHDQFEKLIDKGYLVHKQGNTYDFYELPQTRTGVPCENSTRHGSINFEECTPDEIPIPAVAKNKPSNSTEIYNSNPVDNGAINNYESTEENPYAAYIPHTKELTISSPTADGRKRPKTAFEAAPTIAPFDF